MSIVYVMCGVSGSGKSTFARELIEKNPRINYVSTDKIREKLWGDANDQQRPKDVFETAYKYIEICLANEEDVLFDATNLKARDRRKFISHFRRLGYDPLFVCIVMNMKLETCVQRQETRERKVPRAVIERQYNQMQFPFTDEGWDTIKVIEEI